jgi:hypothetical protein
MTVLKVWIEDSKHFLFNLVNTYSQIFNNDNSININDKNVILLLLDSSHYDEFNKFKFIKF